MAQQQLTRQQHHQIAHILDRLPALQHPPPKWFVWRDGKEARVYGPQVEGMVQGMRSEVKKLEAMYGGAVVAVDGIVSLELCLSLAQLVAWMCMPACSQVQELCVSDIPKSVGDMLSYPIRVREPRLRILESVSEEGWEQGMDVFFAALAQLHLTASPHQPKLLLSQLRLFRSQVFGRGRVCGHLAQQLLRSSTTSSSWLKRLELHETGMGAEGIGRIAYALQSNTTLKYLAVYSCPEVGDAGVKHLSAMLLKNATLEELHLISIRMTGRGICYLCYALSSSSSGATTLKVLRLEGMIGVRDGVDAENLGHMLASNTSLEQLIIPVEDSKGRIAQGLRNNGTLKELELKCGVSDLKQLFSAVASNTTLSNLQLKTTSSGMLLLPAAREFGEMLTQNRSLQGLSWIHERTGPSKKLDQIRSRGHDDEGHFAHALRNNTALRTIDIPASVLGRRGVEHLFTSLADYNTTLTQLAIRDIHSGGVRELARMLTRNRSLQELDLTNAGYSAHDWSTVIIPALAHNQDVKKICCGNCPGIAGEEVLGAFLDLLRTNTLLEVIFLGTTVLGSAGKAELVQEELKLNRQFRAALNTLPSAKPRTCRIVLCGKEYAGKSTLLRTLKEVQEGPELEAERASFGCCGLLESHFLKSLLFNPDHKELCQRTRGIDIQELQDNAGELRMSVWDFAGHQEYHALHDVIFPGVSNGATVFVFTFRPIMENSKARIKKVEQLSEELRYWLRFIISNMKEHYSPKPTVVVVVTHTDLVRARYGMEVGNWYVAIENEISKLIQDFKFQERVNITSKPHFVNAMDGKDVAQVLTDIKGLLKVKLDMVPKQPVICEKIAFALKDMEQGTPVITTQQFASLCKDVAAQEDVSDASLQAFFANGDRGWRAVAAYLDSAGEILYDSKLDFLVKNPKWFGHGIMGHLVGIFWYEGLDDSIVQPCNLLSCCIGGTLPNVVHEAPELPTNGLMTRDGLKRLLNKALQSVSGLQPDCVRVDDLIELMKLLNLCFELNPGHPDTLYLIPATFEDDKSKLVANGKRPLNWLGGIANSCFGRRLECADRDRTFLTPGFFPKLQVVLLNTAVEKKWVEDGSNSNFALEKYLCTILVEDMQIFVEYAGFAGYFVDILVKSSRPPEETLKFVQSEIISLIRSICASQKGCQGVTLAESIIRPACVSGPMVCFHRRNQSVMLENLTEKLKASSDHSHQWSVLKDNDDGSVILDACADSAKDLMHGGSSSRTVSPTTVSPTAVSGVDRGYPKHIVVTSADVGMSTAFFARIAYGKVVPLKFHLKCECRGGEHEVKKQPGRTFYVVDDRFAMGKDILKVMLAVGTVAVTAGGIVVPGVGAAGQVFSMLPAYRGSPVYAETIESVMKISGSTNSGIPSVGQLRSQVEREMQDSRPGYWMEAFLMLQDYQAFQRDFSLRKVEYYDNSTTAWLCEEHMTDGLGQNILRRVL